MSSFICIDEHTIYCEVVLYSKYEEAMPR